MKSHQSNDRPRDVFANNGSGRRARCKAYANAVRIAFEDVHAPWPLLLVRRDQPQALEIDYQAACVITEVRSRGDFPCLEVEHFEQQLGALGSAFRSLSTADVVVQAAKTMAGVLAPSPNDRAPNTMLLSQHWEWRE